MNPDLHSWMNVARQNTGVGILIYMLIDAALTLYVITYFFDVNIHK